MRWIALPLRHAPRSRALSTRPPLQATASTIKDALGFSQPSHGRQDPFHALMIGAGYAMFGTPEGPWNIAKRLEARVGGRLKVDAVVEVDRPRAEQALSLKRDSLSREAYASTQILQNVNEYADKVRSGEMQPPRAIFIATPPMFRGGLSQSNNLELQLTALFPEANIFLEKPVATGAPWEQSVGEAKEVGGRLQADHKGVISVGYVLRYLKAVQEMKRIIRDNNLTVMATNARWISAYELAIKPDWWNNDKLQGPVIEQGTHVCDLSRYFGGDVNVDTVTGHAIEAYEQPGLLSKKGFDESVVPDGLRIPRATIGSWKYTSGAVGTVLHAISLHGVDYSIELEVYADGYQLILSDPYGTPALHMRRPGNDKFEILPTPGDDPYQTEMDHFIDAIEGGPNPEILSTYEDAAKTYEMTWRIRLAAEATSRLVKAQ